MPVYGGTTESAQRLQRQPNLPLLPAAPEGVIAYLWLLDRAITDLYGVLAERLQTYTVLWGTAAFGAADTSIAVTFGSAMEDTNYVPLLVPSWNAATWYTSLGTGGFTVNASAAPGGGGGSVRWAALR